MTVDLAPYESAVPDSIVARLRGARHALTVSHENPDADTVGAALGVATLIEAHGGTADPLCSDEIPALYQFMPGSLRFRTDPDPDANYDLLVVLDCGSLDRIGEVAARHADLFARLPMVVIDHHASNDATGETDWIDPAAAATCEMVALLAGRLGVDLAAGEGALATNLMAGIVMDTATFAHPNATPRTLSVSAALVEAGAPLSDISRRLYRSKPDAQLRLFGLALARLESADDGRIVWSSLTDADLVAAGAERAHAEGIIDLLSQAEAAEVAILFKE
ncbi:MAG TPA: DHH family phosphoesterase, partial [Candidatus Limnocylindrales bacterium]|nr:DHH family phosphoesterase [Candidatus Limnocylindrales bacterium]